ncbi:nucleoside hydrolase [Aquiflexum lacus]|uniref:nucleoside hydrolase n=1 Tax=Aquiflexum lacus TaxID=2483805 RepID=UPI001E653C2E|nr:nucleoside hydrolase [Aquiflexum lacus]
MKEKKLVFMEHDGAIDDLLSQLLLLTMKEVEVIGINVTPADCFIEPAIESTFKLLQLFGNENIPIGRSDKNGINAFPNEWRARPEVINALPSLINCTYNLDPYSLPEAVDLLIDQLTLADRPVTILLTGPCSNLVEAIRKAPHIRGKIEQVVWMGGAFRTQGNVQTYQHNGTAEWNVYWDPQSSKELFVMELPLVCIPLDVTNNVPVNKEFLSTLAFQSDYFLSNLAGQLWALTIDTIPSYHYVYFMWDVLATSFISLPNEFALEEVKAVVSDRPPNAGQTQLIERGHPLKIAVDVNRKVFYEYVLNQLKTEISLQSTATALKV